MQDAFAGLPRVSLNLRFVRFSGCRVTLTQKKKIPNSVADVQYAHIVLPV